MPERGDGARRRSAETERGDADNKGPEPRRPGGPSSSGCSRTLRKRFALSSQNLSLPLARRRPASVRASSCSLTVTAEISSPRWMLASTTTPAWRQDLGEQEGGS